MSDPPQPSETLSPRVLAGMIVLAAAGAFVNMVGLSRGWLLAWMVSEVAVAAMVVVAAGGFGHVLVKLIVPSAPPALRAVTACATGLWMLSTAVLAAGAAFKGSLTPWVWWPVIGIGLALAVVQGFARLRTWRLRPAGGQAMVWVLAAAAAGLWLAGASRPPGSFGASAGGQSQGPSANSATFDFAGDQYDILEYHLQVPREYYDNGQIGPLRHNCYSFYPMGTEMLFLLAMCLRGGAMAGMYLANLMHGVFAILAAAAVFLACRGDRVAGCGLRVGGNQDEETGKSDGSRGRFALGLLITCPLVLYLSWLAMVELAEACYLALALAYLRYWLGTTARVPCSVLGFSAPFTGLVPITAPRFSGGKEGGNTPPLPVLGEGAGGWGGSRETPHSTGLNPTSGFAASLRIACVIGFMLGAACSAKYVAAGMVALPVAAVMIAAAWRNPRRLAAAPAVVLAAALAMSPWLIRNLAYNGNPVFPLGTTVFGRGPCWTAQEQRRWLDGTGPDKRPPVPAPPGWQMPPQPTRAQWFYRNFLASEGWRDLTLILAGVYLCVMAASAVRDPWDWCLLGVLAVQLAAWTAFARQMPPRFLLPAIVPLALLGAGTLERLANVRTNPFARSAAPPPHGRWGLAPAVAIFLAVAAVNAITVYNVYAAGAAAMPQANGIPGEQFTIASDLAGRNIQLGPGRLLLVGDARAFLFPGGSVYATVFDPNPLADMVEAGMGGRAVLADLQRRGVTHLWINWGEIVRLSRGYGFPPALGGEAYARGMRIEAELRNCRARDEKEYQQAKERLEDQFPPAMGIISELESLGARRIPLTGPATAATQPSKVSPWSPWLIRLPPPPGNLHQ